MNVQFRNVDVDRSLPIDRWPFEAIVTMIERGTVSDWVQLTRAIACDPWGSVARQVEEHLSHERPYGVAPLLERAISSPDHARIGPSVKVMHPSGWSTRNA